MRRMLLAPRNALRVGAAGGVRHEGTLDIAVAAVVLHVPVDRHAQALLPGHLLFPAELFDGAGVDCVRESGWMGPWISQVSQYSGPQARALHPRWTIPKTNLYSYLYNVCR